MNSQSQLKICFLPGREASYARTRVLLKGLKDAGCQVYDCSSSDKGRLRYLKSFFKFLKYKGKSDCILVGFFGHFLVPLVRIFTRKKILFDSFVSVHMTMVVDRKRVSPSGFFSKLCTWADYWPCKLADVVFAGTQAEIDYLLKGNNLNAKKFKRLWVGSDDEVMRPQPNKLAEEFTVHFHGEFQPLHGIEYILHAAKKLPDIKFVIIGHGMRLPACQKLAEELGLDNVKMIRNVAYDELPDFMAQASVCLGVFGNTPKTQVVIPHKVFEALAVARPVLTADTVAARELLTSGQTAILCPAADPQALADAILFMKNNPSLREQMAQDGHSLFLKKCLPVQLGRKIMSVVKEMDDKKMKRGKI